jgi:predicted membrane channel-forming protein YqfA (hemolysin III family)
MRDATDFAYFLPASSCSLEHHIRQRLQRVHRRARAAFRSIQTMSRYPWTSNDVPALFVEPFIVHGYRPIDQPWSFYWKSLFHKHNETINVWSHVIGIVYIVHLFVSYHQRLKFVDNAHSWPFAVSLCTAMGMFACSAFAHLLHSKSSSVHMICFTIDYVGISLHGFGSGFVHIYYSAPQWYYNRIESSYVLVLLFLGIVACFFNCFAQYYFRRPYPASKRLCQFLPCGILWIYSVIPLLIRLMAWTGPFDGTAMCHFGQILLFLLGALLFACDLPQRFWPGTLDFVGQGHHLFHFCIYLVTLCQMHGVHSDYQIYRAVIDQRKKPDLIFCVGSAVALFVWDVIIVCCFRRWMSCQRHIHHQ